MSENKKQATAVLASGNAGKIKEIHAILAEYQVDLRSQDHWAIESVEETGSTFVENALLKARHASRETGLPAMADDSGLVVEALGGAPGVISARFAGENATDQDNIQAVLTALKQQGVAESPAAFVCVIVTLRTADDPLPGIYQGIWPGKVVTEISGAGGFGYDPIFIDSQSGVSAAELSPVDKNQRSHRGQALAQFKQAVQSDPFWAV